MAETMKPVIALVTDAIAPYHRGGKESRYLEVAQRLTRDAEVHVYTMNWWRGPATRHDGGVTYHAICPLLPLYAGDRRSIVQALVFALACFRLAFRRFDALEADHMPYVQLLPLRIVTWIRRKRLVATWHEFWGPAYWRDYLGRLGVVGWWFERVAMLLPDAIIAASVQTGERVRPWVRDGVEVAVAPNGVDLAKIRRVGAASDTTDLVLVGRMLEHKRVDRLLEMVALLRDDGQPLSCRLIGDGPARESLLRLSQELGVDHLVDFRHDVVAHDELYALLKASRAFVFPSEREGFGIAVLEALACGLPVVTTAAEDNLARHLVADSGRGIVCAPEPPAMADAVRRVLAAGVNGDGVGDDWVEQYDWRRVTDEISRVVLG
jgi:glycosyltransferase involved in cell wall biosynthesis